MSSTADPSHHPDPRWDWALPAVQAALAVRRPRRVLLLCGAGVTPQFALSPDVELTCAALAPGAAAHAVACRPDDLPFQSRVFEALIVVAVLGDGAEPAFSELRRVLEPGGLLLVLGEGPCSRLRRRRTESPVGPAIRLGRLRRSMAAQSFELERGLGHGLAGWQLDTGSGWRRPLLALSDAILLVARHHGRRPVVTPLRFAQPQALGSRSTVLDGLNRAAP